MIREDSRSQVILWLTSGCILIFLMVLIGGITRLTGSGLSMTDWKLISGSVPPMNEAEWTESFEAYKQFPEYEIQPRGFSLSDYKRIFWWEYIHRALGRFIGIVFIVPFLYFLIKKKISGPLIWKLLILLCLGGLQGFFGWYMVKSGLDKDPHVSHYRLAIHLVTALVTFAYTFWLILSVYFPNKLKQYSRKIHRASVFITMILFAQIIYGAFTAGLKAGLFYNTFPKMGRLWFPEEILYMEPTYLNFIEGIAGVQFVHRYLGIALFVLGVVYWIMTARSKSVFIRNSGQYVMTVVFIQVVLGIFALVYQIPLFLALIHQIGAFFLLTTLVYSLRVSKYSI